MNHIKKLSKGLICCGKMAGVGQPTSYQMANLQDVIQKLSTISVDRVVHVMVGAAILVTTVNVKDALTTA